MGIPPTVVAPPSLSPILRSSARSSATSQPPTATSAEVSGRCNDDLPAAVSSINPSSAAQPVAAPFDPCTTKPAFSLTAEQPRRERPNDCRFNTDLAGRCATVTADADARSEQLAGSTDFINSRTAPA